MKIIRMSNLQDMPSCSKPIDIVQDICEDIKTILNTIKFDVGCIKSDLSIIKEAIKEKQRHPEGPSLREDAILNNQVKKQDALSKGWFFSY